VTVEASQPVDSAGGRRFATGSANPQRDHYERILANYDTHYFDKWSMRYRSEFVFGPMWGDLDLDGKRVADLACGSGFNSVSLRERFPRARVTGFDISPSACAAYRKTTGFAARQCDLTKPLAVAPEFDAAIVIGGLHHCVADLQQTMSNVAAMLTPGGLFMMLEPSSEFCLETLRNLWYRHDSNFDHANEHALAHDTVLATSGGAFVLHDVRYFGGPAYFGVLNSMILRIPLAAKAFVSPPLIVAERLWNRLPGRAMFNVFLARWRRV
jgi:SAM-dependent methyltransferase